MSSYLLPYDRYTLCNAMLWGNCYNHFKIVCSSDRGGCWKSIFHITIAMVELIPVVGQIVSLVEFFFAFLYYRYFSEAPPPARPLRALRRRPALRPPPPPPPGPALEGPARRPPPPHTHRPPLSPSSSLRALKQTPGASPPPPLSSLAGLPRRQPRPPELPFESKPLAYLDWPFKGQVPILQPHPNDGSMSERAPFYLNSFSNPAGIPSDIWSHLFSFLNERDLTNVCCISVFKPLVSPVKSQANTSLFSQSKLFSITSKFFQLVGYNPGDALHRLRKRIKLIQKLLSNTNQTQFPVTQEILSLVQIEFQTQPINQRYVALYNGGPYYYSHSEYCLTICPTSTRESLFVQFLFRYAFNHGTPLTKNSRFCIPPTYIAQIPTVYGSWELVFDFALSLQIIPEKLPFWVTEIRT